jgi:hypothetical protein
MAISARDLLPSLRDAAITYLQFGGSQSHGHLFDRKVLRLDRAPNGSNAAQPCGSRIPWASLLELGLSLAWCSVWSSGIGTPRLALGGWDSSSATSSSWGSSLAHFSQWCCWSSSAHGSDAIPEIDHSIGLGGDTNKNRRKSRTAAGGNDSEAGPREGGSALTDSPLLPALRAGGVTEMELPSLNRSATWSSTGPPERNDGPNVRGF